MHEIGIYDLSASIDYVLKETGAKKLQYLGHSQGTTAFFILLSEKPEYNDKIELMHAVTPAAFFSHSTSLPFRIIASFAPSLIVGFQMQLDDCLSYIFLLIQF